MRSSRSSAVIGGGRTGPVWIIGFPASADLSQGLRGKEQATAQTKYALAPPLPLGNSARCRNCFAQQSPFSRNSGGALALGGSVILHLRTISPTPDWRQDCLRV